MEAPIKTRYDKAGPQVAEALRRRRFEAHYVSTAQEALDLALTLIPKDRTVSWGGTATAAQIGLMDRLHQGDYQLIDRDTGKTPEEKQALMRQALTCGTFIMSSNAISADGQLVNIDGQRQPGGRPVLWARKRPGHRRDEQGHGRSGQRHCPGPPGGGPRQRPALRYQDPLRRHRQLRRLHQFRLHLLPDGHHPGLSSRPAASRSFWWARIWAFKAKEGFT